MGSLTGFIGTVTLFLWLGYLDRGGDRGPWIVWATMIPAMLILNRLGALLAAQLPRLTGSLSRHAGYVFARLRALATPVCALDRVPGAGRIRVEGRLTVEECDGRARLRVTAPTGSIALRVGPLVRAFGRGGRTLSCLSNDCRVELVGIVAFHVNPEAGYRGSLEAEISSGAPCLVFVRTPRRPTLPASSA